MRESGLEFYVTDHIFHDLIKSWLKTADHVIFMYKISGKSLQRKFNVIKLFLERVIAKQSYLSSAIFEFILT